MRISAWSCCEFQKKNYGIFHKYIFIQFGQGNFLSDTEWKTYVLTWKSGKFVQLFSLDTGEIKKLDQPTPSGVIEPPISVTFLSQGTKIKPHLCEYFFKVWWMEIWIFFYLDNYLETTSTQSKILSPMTYEPEGSEKPFCLEVSVSLCENCILTFDIIDQNNQTRPAATILGKSPKNPLKMLEWETVRVNKRIAKDLKLPLGLKITTLVINDKVVGKFWAISNIRRCYAGLNFFLT